jgi:hypothetical protein
MCQLFSSLFQMPLPLLFALEKVFDNPVNRIPMAVEKPVNPLPMMSEKRANSLLIEPVI